MRRRCSAAIELGKRLICRSRNRGFIDLTGSASVSWFGCVCNVGTLVRIFSKTLKKVGGAFQFADR